MTSKLFDSALCSESGQAFDFITNLLESSTEYSIIATGHDGKILPRGAGVRAATGIAVVTDARGPTWNERCPTSRS